VLQLCGHRANLGLVFVRLKELGKKRTAAAQSVQAVAPVGVWCIQQFKTPWVFSPRAASVSQLGKYPAFVSICKEHGGAKPRQQLLEARNQLLGMAAQSRSSPLPAPSGLEDAATVQSRYRLAPCTGRWGSSARDVGTLLKSNRLGGSLCGNDFVDEGGSSGSMCRARPGTAVPSDLKNGACRMTAGGLVLPFSNFAEGKLGLRAARVKPL